MQLGHLSSGGVMDPNDGKKKKKGRRLQMREVACQAATVKVKNPLRRCGSAVHQLRGKRQADTRLQGLRSIRARQVFVFHCRESGIQSERPHNPGVRSSAAGWKTSRQAQVPVSVSHVRHFLRRRLQPENCRYERLSRVTRSHVSL